MIALDAWFWIMIVIFGTIGMLRGWTKEIVASAGLVLSLFALQWFGHFLILPLAGDSITEADRMEAQFYVCAAIHLMFAFFSFQGPTLVRQVSGGRFGERARGAIQESLLGFVVGALNGYLIVGSLWAFLEYDIVAKVYFTGAYPFAAVVRPLEGTAAYNLITNLPLPMLESWLPFLIVVLFLFVIVAMI